MKRTQQIFLLFFLLPVVSVAQEFRIYKVVREVKFLSEPDTKAKIIRYLQPNERVELIRSAQDKTGIKWSKIRDIHKKEGFVIVESNSEIYLQPTSEGWICNYFPNMGIRISLFDCIRFSPNKNAHVEYAIADIFYLSGLNTKLNILDTREIGDNCGAVLENESQYLIVNNDFLSKITQRFVDPIPMYVILAHEIAHHLNADTRTDSICIQQELNADFFSGTILKKMNVGEEKLNEILAFLDNHLHGGTHPSLNDRKATIFQAWKVTPKFDSSKEIRKKLEKSVYDNVDKFQNGFAIVRKDGKFGFVNNLGREIIAPTFDEVENFNRFGYAKVRSDSSWKIIDKFGRIY